MKKILLFVFLSLFLLVLQKIDISANSKAEIPYEINNISIDKNKKQLLIDGWGFITDAQNFKNASTHKYTLQLKSNNHTVTSAGTLRNISHTDTMLYFGSRWCQDNEYHKSALICNNRYENVGFRFAIPLSELKMNKEYVATLKIDAFQSKTSKSILIYFPVKDKLILKDNNKQYIVDSKLNDMSLKVTFQQVLVRDKAGKAGKILQSKLTCASRKALYYQTNSRFNKIYDKTMLNHTTYYKLSGKEIGCSGGKPYVNEGNNLYPIWIASNFVDYLGQPLIVKTREENTPPTITTKNNPIIYVGEKINFYEGVSAYDKEDGDITHKLTIIYNNFKNTPGYYYLTFKVTDSQGLSAVKNKYITVLKRNYPPVINAHDIELEQFSNYNPYLYATAYDQDQENITHKLIALNKIDTSKLLLQRQCYMVTDKYNLTTSKCVYVNIVKAKRAYRFIQKQRLFYKEDIPIIWQNNLHRLDSEINNEIVYKKRSLSK